MSLKNSTNGHQSPPEFKDNSEVSKVSNKAKVVSSTNSNSMNLPKQQILTQTNGFETQDDEFLSPEELAEIWARRAHHLAEEPPDAATGQTVDLLVFELGSERYGIEVTNVREIYPLQQLTLVPRTPDFVAGVFSARGRILSVIDLRAFLGMPANGLPNQTKIIVVANTDRTSNTAHMEVGILADEVADVITLFKDDIEPPLTTHTGARAEYTEGITADMLVVLDLNALLSDKRLIVQEEII